MVKSALLLRAIEDVKRIWRIRDDKAALTSLHQRGLLGDDTKARFEFAEKELEAEILDVVQEANSFKQGWGGLIFATATEMAQAERTRETVLSIPRIRQREGEFERDLCKAIRTITDNPEKRLALRRKYLPDSDPSITPATPAAPAQIASGSTSGSGTSTPAKHQGQAAVSVATPSPAQVTAIEKEGDATLPLSPAQAAAAATAGGGSTGPNSGASTPSKVCCLIQTQ